MMKTWLLGAVASTALLAACGGRDATEPTQIAEAPPAPEAPVAAPTPAPAPVQLQQFTLRDGDAAEAPQALAQMALDESGKGRVSFGGQQLDGAAATFNDVTIDVDDDDPDLRIGALSFLGLETTEDGAASFSQMTLSDIRVASPAEAEEDVTIGVGEIKLVNPSPALAGWVATLFENGEPGDLPAAEDVSFDAFTIDGVDLDFNDGDDEGVLKLASLAVTGKTADTLGGLLLSGVDVDITTEDDEKVKFAVEEMSLSGADLSFMTAIQEAIASGADDDEIAAAIQNTLTQNPGEPGYDAVSLTGLAVDAAGVKFDIPSMDVDVQRNDAGQAVKFVTNPFAMTFSADPSGAAGAQVAGPLSMMGYETLELTAQAEADYDPETDIYTLSPARNRLKLKDGFDIGYGYKIEGYGQAMKDVTALSATGEDPDPDALLSALSAASLHNFELQLTDESIVDRGFTLAAAMSGQDAAALRGQAQMMVGFLPLMAGESGADPALLSEVSAGLASFISNPGTLTLKLDPSAPISAASFASPGDATKEALGFSMVATPKAADEGAAE